MPLDEQRSHWDLKYEQGLPSLEKPDPFYLSSFDQFVADSFPNGDTALDLAGGIGRHALWLAKKNWQVTVVDISEVAIRTGRSHFPWTKSASGQSTLCVVHCRPFLMVHHP
jgi:2-polyprenyl-3-methyl-5-hydroxy-6-metoxy-1,4-benzoquinol methylase